MNERCFPKLGKIELKEFQNPGLSLRGKNRTQNGSPNEEKNKNTNTNAYIGTLLQIMRVHNLENTLASFNPENSYSMQTADFLGFDLPEKRPAAFD